tara:strand:+ start:2106 stop:2531 length:426 start_codon:yes stop_codon:yes gene_type:complete
MSKSNSVKVALEEMAGNAPSYLLYGSGMLLLGVAFLFDHLHNATVLMGKKAINKAFPVGQKSEVVARATACHAEKEREPAVSRERIDDVSEVSPKAGSETTIIDEQPSTDSSSTGEVTPLKASAEVQLQELKFDASHSTSE